jgi:hypothetical protein
MNDGNGGSSNHDTRIASLEQLTEALHSGTDHGR